jgi:hypothetical protein
MICRYVAGCRRRGRPFSCLIAFCGTDGSLLAPVTPMRGECWDDIELVLRPLLLSLISTRLQAGMTFEEALPTFIATDSYGKHRFKYRDLMRDVSQQLRLQPEGLTPRGSAAQLRILNEDSNPADQLTTIAGEPYHDVIKVRTIVSPYANDHGTFVPDHSDMLCRLSAAKPPVDPCPSQVASLPTLGKAGRALLKKAVQVSPADFLAVWRTKPAGTRALKRFLASPAVRKAKHVWREVFQAQPPRPVLARLARLVGVTLPDTCGYYNYTGKSDFVSEVKRMQKWYHGGRRLTRRRRGLLRVLDNNQVRGRRSVWSKKLTTHYRRLVKPTRLRGLMHWRRCALALHTAGLAVHSGTIPVERHWCQYASYWPPAVKSITEPTFALLSGMCMLRYNWGHFNKPWRPKWTRGDVLLQQRAAEMIAMLHAADVGDITPIETELVNAFRSHASELPAPKRRRLRQAIVADDHQPSTPAPSPAPEVTVADSNAEGSAVRSPRPASDSAASAELPVDALGRTGACPLCTVHFTCGVHS